MQNFRIMLASALVGVVTLSTAPASATVYETVLVGTDQVPPVVTSARGFAWIKVWGDSLTATVSFKGLADASPFGHIHCCAPDGMNAGVAIPFTMIPAATSGSFTQTFDLLSAATYTGGFLAAHGGTAMGARDALLAGLTAFQSYVNIHDATHPSGEIRGQLAVPEAATLGLFGLGAGALVAARRRRG